MFGPLNATQIQSISQQQQQQQQQEQITHLDFHQNFDPYQEHQHQLSSKSPNPLTRNFFTRNTASLLEKFLQTDFLHKVYEPLKNNKHLSNEHNSYVKSKLNHINAVPIIFHGQRGKYYPNLENEKTLNCHRTTSDKTEIVAEKTSTMTIKCSKNLLAVETAIQSPATLQNYQKISEADTDLVTDVLVPSSGASSGEFNCSSDTTTTSASSSSATTNGGNNAAGRNSSSATNSSSSLYKRFGGRISSVMKATTEARTQGHKAARDTALKTSITLNHSRNSLNNIALKSNDLQRSSSSSSAGDYLGKRERKKGAMTPQPQKTPLTQLFSANSPAAAAVVELDGKNSGALVQTGTSKLQRRKLMQLLTALDQQNKLLQRELAKEKRRRSEELACVVKSLICFEAKLKGDMKSANEQLLERDMEICRLVQQNRALRQHIYKLNETQNNRDEGVVADGDVGVIVNDGEIDLNEDCLVLEALQCINCRQQFHDIRYNKQDSQTLEVVKEHGGQNNDDPTSEHCSSSDDTASSSFFGARRSVRYTSKRTSGTFRDYMHSRAMNIDHPELENCNNTLEFNNTSYEKLNLFSRTIERMHGVKSESERDSEQSGLDSSTTRSASRTSTKSSKSSLSSGGDKVDKIMNNVAEEDDGIFSPTLDDDYEDDHNHHHHHHHQQQQQQAGNLNNLERSTVDLSEDTPKQVYETSTDDWYASASDQDEITGTAQNQCYSQGAVNPVLECVNQILIQQSMEGPEEQIPTHKTANSITLPRRSSLSDSRHSRQNSTAGGNNTPNSRNGTLTRKRVHFSTKNSMVHVPRNDDLDLEDDDDNEINGSVDNGNNQVMPMANRLISNFQEIANYIVHSPPLNEVSISEERLEALNYESIYSNEYEPIGSEMNSSNLYMDMDTASKTDTSFASTLTDVDDINKFNGSNNKLPPALPPKPANLLKFKKSLQQLNECADETTEAQTSNNVNETNVEPDYCSISEVNVGITNVQITADVHQAPLSESDLEYFVKSSEMDLDRHSTVVSASDAGSQKTEEIEEIFADIPKLPNVAAIIAPKSSINFPTTLQNNYIMMSPNVKDNLNESQKDMHNTKLNSSPIKIIKTENIPSGSTPQHSSTPTNNKQYKRKHIPNIIMEINKRTTSTSACGYVSSSGNNIDFQKYNTNMNTNTNTNSYSKSNITETEVMQNLPIQAEFDWYNLDAEYGRFGTIDMMNVNEAYNPVKISMLAEIQEDGESIATTADEYNLDDEFAQELETEKQMKLEMEMEKEREREKEIDCESDRKRKIDIQNTLELIIPKHQLTSSTNSIDDNEEKDSSSSSSSFSTSIKQKETDNNLASGLQKANKIKNNLANFEKFIENSGLSTKPLPTKRRIYYAEPFV